jgi:hypothetical protein
MKKSLQVQPGPNVSIEETFDSNYCLKSEKNEEILEIGCQEERSHNVEFDLDFAP